MPISTETCACAGVSAAYQYRGGGGFKRINLEKYPQNFLKICCSRGPYSHDFPHSRFEKFPQIFCFFHKCYSRDF